MLSMSQTDLADGQVGRGPIREKLRELFTELNEYQEEKKRKLADAEKLEQRIQNLEKDRQRRLKDVHPLYNRSELVKKGIKELEKRLHTSTLTREEEKRVIRDIEKVRNSVPIFEKIDKLRDQ